MTRPMGGLYGKPIGSFQITPPQGPGQFEIWRPVPPPLPGGAPPPWPPPPDGSAFAESAAANSRLVGALTGAKTPPRLQDGFNIVFTKLQTADGRNNDLVAELEALRVRIVERLQGQRAARMVDLKGEHGELFQKCRDALDRKNDIATQLNRVTSLAQTIAFEPLGAAKAAVAAVEAERPLRENYPSQGEVAQWHDRLGAARARLAAEQRKYDEQIAAAADLTRQLQAAEQEFQSLSDQEQSLAAQVAGQPWQNVFGVICPPVEPEI